MSKYSLRPVQNKSAGKPDLKDIYKIFVPSKLYISLQARARDLWILDDANGRPVAIGRLTQAQDEVQNKVLQVTQEFKDLFGLSFTETYDLRKSSDPVRQAVEVTLIEDCTPETAALISSDTNSQQYWRGRLWPDLVDKLVSPGLRIQDVKSETGCRSFKVKSISSSSSSIALSTALDVHMVSENSVLTIEPAAASRAAPTTLKLRREGILGLDEQLEAIDEVLWLIDPLENPDCDTSLPGLLLSGPSGVGKELVAERIAELPWSHTLVLTQAIVGKNPETSLPRLFAECLKNQPSLVIIPSLKDLISVSGSNLPQTLCDVFRTIDDQRVLVLAASNEVEFPKDLLQCFEQRIEFYPPNESLRRDILLDECDKYGVKSSTAQDLFSIISQKTPGYTGLDLHRLVKRAKIVARQRLKSASTSTEGNVDSAELSLLYEDFEAARKRISPSALADGQLSKHSTVRWSDIGGQEETKKTIELLFEWPLKYPERFKALNIDPGKGLLLYGPPGCSKTMTALALATEAKLNFIAVKGPELLSKYVGESEQNLRNVFARARSAAPCVIFFDEVDSIGSSSGVSGESKGGGVNLVTTLLNELDGVDELKGVSVLAATNRPWELDQALLRPGRFDGMVYVRLPDAKTRRDILEIRLKLTQHDSSDIDVERLVVATEGCSGAEIVDLCRNAAIEALKEQILSPTEDMRVRSIHFDAALKQLRRDTSPEMIERFDAFANRARGG